MYSYFVSSAEDLILNPKEHPNAKKGDVVEIYHPDEDHCRLLLQITSLSEDLKGKGICEEVYII